MVLCMMMWSLSANAIPAKPGLTRQLTLTDGTTITAQLVGDEFGHYWKGSDGKAYQLDDATGLCIHIDHVSLASRAQSRRAQANARRQGRLSPRRVSSSSDYTGKKKGLIILVNFSDVTFNNSKTSFESIANTADYSSGKFVGSVYDYFYDQSNGDFQLTFDVVGPVTVSQSQSYYGGDDEDGEDYYPATMVREAVQLADSQVNYADYDWNNDGAVDQVYVIYAGKGEADGGGTNTIWPHEWTLSAASKYGDGDGAITLDGKTINTYACGPELDGGTGNIAGIGTLCHEFSHCLGFPDFYDTSLGNGQGMGFWDLMDNGSYNGGSYRPAGYTSYERWVAGWLTPTELKYTTSVTGMQSLQNGGECYIIYNTGDADEYFLLENRQLDNWDTSLPGAGLLILHVDYDESLWDDNEVNIDADHQRMTWIAADNDYQYTTDSNGSRYYTFSEMAYDTYPQGDINSFGSTTTPAARFYNETSDGSYLMSYSVLNITQNSDGTISFDFEGETPAATLTFSQTACTATVSTTDFTEPTLTIDPAGLTVTYASSNQNVATVDASTGQVTIAGTGQTIISASFAGNDSYQAATASYTLTVTDPNFVATGRYELITSTDELEAGKNYLLVYTAGSVAYDGFSDNWGQPGSVTISSNVIDLNDENNNATPLILETSTNGNWLIHDNDNKIYLALMNAGKTLNSQSSATGTGTEWTISFNSGKAYINSVSYSDYYLQYNKSSKGFRCYTGTQQYPALYKEVFRDMSISLADDDSQMDEGSSNADIIAENMGYAVNATLLGRTLYKDGNWNTLCLPFDIDDISTTPLANAKIKALESSAFESGTLTLNFSEDDLTSIDAGTPYIAKWEIVKISNADEWKAFAQRVNAGETTLDAMLTADITDAVTQTVGTSTNHYAGTFYGQGHTLKLAIVGTGRTGAFSYISGATIRDLVITGAVSISHPSGKFGGSIVGSAYGDNVLDHCISYATVTTQASTSGNFNGDGSCGGMVGSNETGTMTLQNCAFYGTLNYGETYANGGFIGWTEGQTGGQSNFINCVFSPAVSTTSLNQSDCQTYSRYRPSYESSVSFTNTYYTEAFGGVQGTLTSYTGSSLASLHNGAPTATTDFPTIESPVFSNVTLSSETPTVFASTDGTTNWVDFVGTYSAITLQKDNNQVLYLGAGNTLYYPAEDVPLNACRAYFQLKGELKAGNPSSASSIKAFELNFGQGMVTGIFELRTHAPLTADCWYTLDGRRLNRKPAIRGLYICNGQKVMIK